MCLTAILSVTLLGTAHTARAYNAPPTPMTPTYYDMVPYSDPLCGCDPEADFPIFGGCCIGVKQIMHEIFTGGGMWMADDFQNDFYIAQLYKKGFEPYFQKMSATWTSAEIINAATASKFIDAQNILRALTSLQMSEVQTQKDYVPSENVCRFGTLSRSMSNSQQVGNVATIALATQAIQRQMMRTAMGSADASAAGVMPGEAADKKARWAQYTKVFCDKDDANVSKTVTSTPSSFCTNTSDLQVNRDIDMTRTLDIPRTLDLDFTASPSTATADTQNIMALASNLYANNVISGVTESDLNAIAKQKYSQETTQRSLKAFFDYRSVVAKRSVAENSLAAIAGLKASSGTAASPYMVAALEKLGLSNTEAKNYLGASPSYYAQMEVLTKKIYQDPAFFANLMDSPQNVARQQAAMEGIALAQDRDIHESLRRSEMLLSNLLEIYVEAEQDKFTDKVRNK